MNAAAAASAMFTRASSALGVSSLLAPIFLFSACVISSGEDASSPPSGASGSAGSGGKGGSTSTGGSAGSGSGGTAGTTGTGGGTASGGSSGSQGSGGTATGGTGGGGTGGSSGSAGNTNAGIRPSGANPSQADAAYQTYKQVYFTDCNGMTRVADGTGSQTTLSEGMGYGMLMVAYLEPDATGPALMKRLNDFVNANLDPKGLMNWKVSCGSAVQQNAATDGDFDMSLALIQAERRWPGNGFGDAAKNLLGRILFNETDGCGIKPGDVWGGCGQEANPSYAALSYLEAFACFTGNAQWRTVRDNTMQRQLAYWFQNYALPPDWVLVDTGSTSGRYSRGNYTYDATRVPWRLALDYLWYQKTDSQAQVTKIVDRIKQDDPDPHTIGDGYSYSSGSKISSNHNAAFVGPLAVGAMVDAKQQSWLDSAYSELVSLGTQNYYSDSLRVIALTALTGRFTSPCP